MGIAIVSSASVSTAGTAAGPSSPDGGGGFSALLGQFTAPPAAGAQFPGGDARLLVSPQVDTALTADDPLAAASSLDGILAAAAQLPAQTGLAVPGEKRARSDTDAPASDALPMPADPSTALAAAALAASHFAGADAATRGHNPASAEGAASPDLPAVLAERSPLGERTAGKGLGDLASARQPAQTDLAAVAGKDGDAGTAKIAAEARAGSEHTSAFATTLAAQPAARHAEAAMPQPTVATPLHSNRWAQDFGDKIVWLARNDQQVAQININPPQLGPVQITLNLAGDQATAVFASPHAEVRQAIEASMPQLREMLAGSGINLGQANVGAQLPQQNGETQQQHANPTRFGGDNAILHGDNGHGAAAVPQPVRGGRGMVDLFA